MSLFDTPTAYGIIFAIGLFIGIPVFLEFGRRLGARRRAEDPEGAKQGFGVVEGAVFSLLGLLIAFTFSGAATRFDHRRELITQEANNIGTAYLRLDLLPAASQPHLRDLFRRYLDSRLEAYRLLPDLAAARAELARAAKLHGEIWTASVTACREAAPTPTAPTPAHTLLLPALNDLIDITTTRTEAAQIHPPPVIFAMLGLLTFASAFLAGYGMAAGGGRRRSWAHILVFSAVMSISVYVIMDIEYPRFGLIRVDAGDRVLMELRESMK